MTSESSLRLFRFASIAYVGIGLIWATAAFAPIDLPARLLFDLLNWPFGDPLPALDRNSRWSNAVGAGLLIGLSLVCLLVIAPELERGNCAVIRGTLIALACWFFVDSSGSVASGAVSNVLWNIPFALGWVVPLWNLRGQGTTTSRRVVKP